MFTIRKNPGRRVGQALVVLTILAGLLGLSACSFGSSGGSSNQPKPGGQAGAASSSFVNDIIKRGELRIGVAPAAPHVYQDTATKQWKGVYVDAMQSVADGLKVKLTPVPTSWNDIVAGLQAGKYDVAVGLNQTMARSQQVLYSNNLLSVLTAFGVHKGKKDTWKEISSPDANVCVVQGTPQVAALKSLPDFKAKLSVLPSVDACQLAFASGRVDADAEDWLSLAGYAKAHSDAAIVFSPTPIALQGVGYGLPHTTSYADLATINAGLTEFVNGGQFASSLKANAVENPLQYASGEVPEYAKQVANPY